MKSANGVCCFEAKAFVPFHSLSSHHCTVPMAQDPELRPCDFSGRIRDIGIGTLQPIARLALTSSSNRKESGIEYRLADVCAWQDAVGQGFASLCDVTLHLH